MTLLRLLAGSASLAVFALLGAACSKESQGLDADDGEGAGPIVTRPDAGSGPTAASRDTCGNGLDDDGNGKIDDGCPCTEGATQKCFAGTAKLAGVGACTMGTQTCVSARTNEFKTSEWGPCTGSGIPSTETCNGVDDDCDGKVDALADGGACAPTPTGSGPPCNGTGLIFTSIGDSCIDDGGGSAADDDLQVFCVNGTARFCLSKEACPWRDGQTTSDAVSCSRAGLASTYFVSARQACGEYDGHTRICCSATGQVSFTGC